MYKYFKERIKKMGNTIPEPMNIHVCGVNMRLSTSLKNTWELVMYMVVYLGDF